MSLVRGSASPFALPVFNLVKASACNTKKSTHTKKKVGSRHQLRIRSLCAPLTSVASTRADVEAISVRDMTFLDLDHWPRETKECCCASTPSPHPGDEAQRESRAAMRV